MLIFFRILTVNYENCSSSGTNALRNVELVAIGYYMKKRNKTAFKITKCQIMKTYGLFSTFKSKMTTVWLHGNIFLFQLGVNNSGPL